MTVELNIKWNGQQYQVHLEPEDTVATLKTAMKEKTEVEPARQKFIGLKTKDGKALSDEVLVGDLLIKPTLKIMMMGTREDVINRTVKEAAAAPEVKDDFDIDPNDEMSIELCDRPEVQERLQRRVDSIELKIMNRPREGKKLLVIDIDYTIFDLGSSAERPDELARPYLHPFMTSCYEYFDIIIWSANSLHWMEIKMRELGVSTNPNYKLVCMVDGRAMVTVQTERYGVFNCKPLEFIWRKFPGIYDSSNTVMLDDLRRNFVMNKQNGLVIRPFKQAHRTRATDRELLDLAEYFQLIGPMESLSHLKHRKWERYLRRAREGHPNPTAE